MATPASARPPGRCSRSSIDPAHAPRRKSEAGYAPRGRPPGAGDFRTASTLHRWGDEVARPGGPGWRRLTIIRIDHAWLSSKVEKR